MVKMEIGISKSENIGWGELLIYTKTKVIYIYMTVVKKKYKSREKKSIQIAMVVEIYTLVNNLYNKWNIQETIMLVVIKL